jgi:hypothetical protein
MQQSEVSLYDQIKETYNETLIMLQELKVQNSNINKEGVITIKK